MDKAQAIKMAESGWWKTLSYFEIAAFQLWEEKLCMDFSDFQDAVEKSLGRPVWTHEFAYPDLLRQEFLGRRPSATFEDILNLIPAEKRVLLCAT